MSTRRSTIFEASRPWVIGAILYGSTLYFSTNALLLLLIPICFGLATGFRFLWKSKSSYFVVAFVVAGMLNATLGMAIYNKQVGDGLRSLITIPLILITISLSRILDDFDVRRAIYVFILLECLVAGLQLYFDSPHPFPGQFDQAFVDYSDFSGFEALYFNRAYGLSANSSILAEKIFILILMLLDGDLMKFRTTVRMVIICLVAVGVVATFNRTVIAASVLFILFWLVRRYCRTWKSALLFLVSAAALVGVFSATYSGYPVDEALNFGVTAGGLDSRYLVWGDAFSFIDKHLFLGNNSMHILFDYFGRDLHAHNSFLQMVANHGLLIAMLLFLFVIINISRTNFPVVVALLIFSLTQYGVFWAISFVDIVFYYYLFTRDRSKACAGAQFAGLGTKALAPLEPLAGTSGAAR